MLNITILSQFKSARHLALVNESISKQSFAVLETNLNKCDDKTHRYFTFFSIL